LSSMGFLLWGCNGCFTPNLEEEAHGFNKWQLGLGVGILHVKPGMCQTRSHNMRREQEGNCQAHE
jgi:hypothetical protein